MDKKTERRIVEAAERIYHDVLKKIQPSMDCPLRSLENVTYDK